jgi:hypothetical protein
MEITRLLFRCTLAFVLAVPAIAFGYQERLILAVQEGNCSLRVEADDQSQTLRLRVLPEGPACHITKSAMQRILQATFSKTHPPKLEGTYTSLFMGRLIEYPWLSQYLALSAYSDPRWDKKKGRPVSMGLHKYVQNILARPEVTAQFDESLSISGYRVAAVTVEKVGVGSLQDVPLYGGEKLPGKMPYDALVWLILAKKVADP